MRTNGFYTQDIFVVAIPEETIDSSYGAMDMLCGDADIAEHTDKDVTGIGLGNFTERLDNEIISYAVSATPNPNPDDIDLRGYGKALANTTFRASYYGKIAEIITFSSRKGDANVTDERNRIESYLALKYGITLGVNGTSQDYVSSNGNIIWDASLHDGYNFDIAGIGRDDDSDLYQKQSKSVNQDAIVSFSLDNTALTNNLNTKTFNTDKEFLIWGNDGNNTNASTTTLSVDLGSGTTTVVTDVMNRKWKIVESAGNDVGNVEVSVLQSDLHGLSEITDNEAYVLIVADDENFTTNLKTVALNTSAFNGQNTVEGTYDFDGASYFTFGIAHKKTKHRNLDFDGIDNYTLVGNKVDLAGDFTTSAWVKLDGTNALASDKTIFSKYNNDGYKFFITNQNTVSFQTSNSSSDRINSNTALPNNVWHHVAVTFKNGQANIYIDGVLDNSKTINTPTPNNASFAIGAVYVEKNDVIDFFKGNIDEVRIWEEALSLEQIHYIMNQELVKVGAIVNGAIVPNSITKNDIATINWTALKAY